MLSWSSVSHIFIQSWLSTAAVTILFLDLFILNWRIIALQCRVGFCRTSAWISPGYTHVLSHLPPTPSCPPRLVLKPWFQLPEPHGRFPLGVYFTCGSVSMLFSPYSFVFKCHVFFIQPSADGHLGFFHVLAVVNSAAVDTGVRVTCWVIVFSGYVPWSGISGLSIQLKVS